MDNARMKRDSEVKVESVTGKCVSARAAIVAAFGSHAPEPLAANCSPLKAATMSQPERCYRVP
jgi:hypothetical protein